jgi:hypothetical protein
MHLYFLIFSLILLSTVAPASVGAEQSLAADGRVTSLQGPYLGQKTPGRAPELFAPGFISRQDYFEHSAAVFTPDLREVYWSAKPNAQRSYHVYFMKMIDGRWTVPQTVPFLDNSSDEHAPVFSPDGRKMYFDRNDDIWVVERQGDGWSEPAVVSEASDPGRQDRISSVAADGSLFFTRSQTSLEMRDIYVSRTRSGRLSEPTKLGKDIPSGYHTLGDVFVAPDESYAILELHADEGTSELFVSYKTKSGSWSDDVKVPVGWARFPLVSPDGKYLFFMRREGIFWVTAKLLEDLGPAAPAEISGR